MKLNKQPTFFILGVQRSGTTLLRLMLNAHPQIAIPEEATFFMPIINGQDLRSSNPVKFEKREAFLSYLNENYQFQKWGISSGAIRESLSEDSTWKEIFTNTYQVFAEKHKKPIYGDKTPSFIRKINILADVFPSAKFIHIVRDGRDIYLSMQSRKKPFTYSAAISAIEWLIKLKFIAGLQDKYTNRFLEIKYEALLENPTFFLIQICEFIGISYDPIMLDFWKTSQQYIDQQHSNLIFSPVNKQNIAKWKTEMSIDDRQVYVAIAQKKLQKLGYTTTDEKISIFNYANALLQLVFFTPIRVTKILWTAMYMKIASSLGLSTSSRFYS